MRLLENHPTYARTLASLLVLLAGTACTANVASTGPGGTGGGGSGAAGGGGAGAAGGQGGTIEPLSCAPEAGDHTSVCASPTDCAISADVEIVCDNHELGALGIDVAVNDETTLFAATSWDYTVLFDVGAESATQVEDFPLDLNATPIALAVDEDGRLHAAGDETTAPDYEGALSFVRQEGEGFTHEVVFDRGDKYIPLHDLAVDAAGRAHVFYASEPPSERSMAVRDEDGTWDTSVVTTPAGSDWHRFALRTDGAPIAFGYRESGVQWQLIARVDGAEQNVGSPSAAQGFGPGRYRPIRNAVPYLDTMDYDYGALVQTDAGLRLIRVTGTAYDEVDIPDTAEPELSCAVGFGDFPPCPETCHEETSGLDAQAFDVARLGNGDTYLAVVVSHIDRVVSYEEQMADGPTCVGNVETEDSTSELRLYRVGLAETSISDPVLTLPLGRYGVESAFTTKSDIHKGVALHAFGNHLAVAIRQQAWSRMADTPAEIRVLRVDTTLLD